MSKKKVAGRMPGVPRKSRFRSHHEVAEMTTMAVHHHLMAGEPAVAGALQDFGVAAWAACQDPVEFNAAARGAAVSALTALSDVVGAQPARTLIYHALAFYSAWGCDSDSATKIADQEGSAR